MSYTRPQALGISWADLQSGIQKGIEYLPAALDAAKMAPDAVAAAKGLAEDPYLGEVICQVRRMKNVEARLPAGPSCPHTMVTAANARKGVGLRYAVTPLRAAVFARQNPWVVPVAVAVILGLPFALGYSFGKGR